MIERQELLVSNVLHKVSGQCCWLNGGLNGMVLIVEPAVLRTQYFVYEPMVHVAQ